MAKETQCQTDGTYYGVTLKKNIAKIEVELPEFINIEELPEDEKQLLIANIHNVLELVFAKFFLNIETKSAVFIKRELDDPNHFSIECPKCSEYIDIKILKREE